MTLRFNGRVAIVTGAGGGLGRSHALALAGRGARVVVNDVGEAAEAVAAEIRAAGGEALPFQGSVTDLDAMTEMVAAAHHSWQRIDILVNNAGILRDSSFAKAGIEDFRAVLDVHVMGAVICTKLVWPHMQAQAYGRVVMTTSSSGLFGNFGQSNYAAAKMALVGLMQTLSLEGRKYDIRVNCLAPTAATQMTAGLIPEAVVPLLSPERVSPGLLALVSEDAPNRMVLGAGAGAFEQVRIAMTSGLFVGERDDAAEVIASSWDRIGDRTDEGVPDSAAAQIQQEATLAFTALQGAGQ